MTTSMTNESSYVSSDQVLLASHSSNTSPEFGSDLSGLMNANTGKERKVWKSDPILAVKPSDIERRYQDFSRVIFKEIYLNPQQNEGFLSYGMNRRRVEYSNFGNNKILIRKPEQSCDNSNSMFCEIT